MPSSALPAFTGVYVFGDSLVDPGNALEAAEFIDDIPFNSLPSGAPTADKGYFQGRFTDGWNFADLISNKLIGQVGKTTFPYGFKDPLFGIDIPFTSRPSGANLSFAFGGAVMGALERVIDATHAFGALSASDEGAALYRGRGWRVWGGRIEVLGPGGIVRLPEEEGGVLLRPAGALALPDPGAPLVFDWRDGDVV